MAGLSGKSAWLGVAKQTGGTRIFGTATPAPAAPTYKLPFSGGSIGPTRETDRLAETDSARDQGAAFVASGGVEGSPEAYVRADSLGVVLAGVLGVEPVAPTGSAPAIIHTFKPQQALPYMTFWKNVGGAAGLYETYNDCIIGSATISADAGAPLTVAMGVSGITPTLITAGATQTTLDAIALNQGTVFNFNNVASGVSIGGSATRAVSSFELTVENNISRQQTDSVLPYDVVVGTREISLGFDMLFENITEYQKFHYGAGNTQISPTIFTTSASFTFVLDVNTSVVFTLPSIAYEEFPIEPDPGGDPIVVSARAVAQKAAGVPDLLTVTLKNNVVGIY